MKKEKQAKRRNPSGNSSPTLFELFMDVNTELRVACGLKPLPFWKQPPEIPHWTKNICTKFRNTILKSVLKLKPKRNKTDWRNYGRIMGCLERYKAFLSHDAPRIFKENGLDKVTKKQWSKIGPQIGLEQMRRYFLKVLNLAADDKTSDEKLLKLVLAQQVVHNEKLKQIASLHLAKQDAKANALFSKGFCEGYTAFLNEEGQFSGDDRRFEVYADLLSMRYEVEKMRRAMPAKARNDLRAELKKFPNFQDRGQKWFNDICDEIKLSMKGVGRAYKFAPNKIPNRFLPVSSSCRTGN